MKPGLRAELERLVSQLCDGALDEAEHLRLESLLRDDAECREFYLAYVDLHVRLMHHPRLANLLDGRSTAPAQARQAPARSSAAPAPAPPPPTPVKRPLWWPYALTATLTLAASLVVQFVLPDGAERAVVPSTAAPVTPVAHGPRVPEYVATLTRAIDCRWDQAESLRPGMRLLPGKLRLQSGTAAFKFDGGAELLLEGPAEFEIAGVTSAAIASGRLRFRSDETAETFDLHTPAARLVDYGTEYAVVVGPQSEEIHVFDGEVVRTPTARAPSGAPLASQSVPAGQARRFDALSGCEGCAVPLDGRRFQFSAVAADRDDDPDVELLAYEPFDCDEATLPCPSFAGGRGWSSTWSRCPKADANCYFTVVGGLWLPQMSTAGRDGALSTARRAALSRKLAQPLAMDRDGVWYVSCLVRSERRQAGAACELQLVLRDERSDRPHDRLAATVSWSNSKTSICWNGCGGRASLPVEPGKTYLLTAKIVAGRTAPDQTFLRLFAPRQWIGGDEPTSWTVVSRPVLSDASFDVVQIAANTSSAVVVDEIRIGRSWRSVAAPYQTSSADPVFAQTK